ncbi:protein containg conserved repeat domain/CSLREA domain [Longilinea arvoryzae]|uniref:Protein containg conserved repeat domain/CSLREA domain n=1 Tax=Longilinea arvoryzae TaxID=360412 RepID=A0A0S7BBJ0_9CHLR|nr:Ig-like domain repeat protein [Longilinea arvoryzae]GAP12605.1 protein containg conserved repeat domain/CSLREA domain [Longilinea arvoryzae]
MKKNFWLPFSALAVVLALAFTPVPFAQAAGPFTVNTSADSHDAAPGNGLCIDPTGQCSLRAAIEEASLSAASTTISLPAGTYDLTLGELQIAPDGNRTIVLNGAGAASTLLHQTNGIDRVISIDYDVVGNVNVTISGLTISGGADQRDHFGGAGILAGSIWAPTDTLTLNNLVFTNNRVSQPDAGFNTQPGGALQMAGGNLTVSNCSFTGNSSAASPGGAIAYIASGNAGTMNITDSTFSGNQVANTALSGPSGGGAIYLNNVTATISRSTFTGNQATSSTAGAAYGGAIQINTGSLTIDHSTFTANVASGTNAKGGAIYVDSAALNISTSRLTGNQASSAGSGIFNHALNNATTTAANNWWGCNGGPTVSGCDLAVTDNAGLTFAPWIVLSHTANPNALSVGGIATLTASFLQNSAGQPLTVNDISVLLGLPVNWANAVNGSLSNQQTSIQPNGQATATFTGGAANGLAGASAQVDNAIVPANLTVTSNADLGVTKTAPAFGVAGDTINYTLTVHNNGPDAAASVVLSDPLPANLTFVSQSQTAGPTFTLSHTGNTISNTISSLPSGETATFTIVATVNATATPGSSLNNTASVSSAAQDPMPGNGSSSATSIVYTKPAITNAATASFTVATAGSFTFTATGYPTPLLSLSGSLPAGVTFTNNGNGTATLAGTPALGTVGDYPVTLTASNASLVDASQNFTLSVAKASPTLNLTVLPNPSYNGQTVTFTATVSSSLGTPTGGVQFSVDGSSLGSPVNLSGSSASLTTSTLSNGDHSIGASYIGDANFTAVSSASPVTQTVNPAADLSISKSAPSYGVVGGTLTYTLSVRNNGPDAATNVQLSDPLPVNTTFVSQSQTNGPAFTLSNAGNTISDSLNSMPSGATATFSITVSVNAAATPGSLLTNTAIVSTGAQDPVTTNNSDSAASTIYANPAITSADHAEFTVATSGSFTVTSTGYPTPALTLAGALPSGVIFSDNGDGTATMSGAPALGTVGSYPVSITANNATGSKTSQIFTLTVQKAAATLALQTSPNPSIYGQAITIRATVTSDAGTPTGTVQFSLDGNYGTMIGLDNGIAVISESQLSAGNHSIRAIYNGDDNFQFYTLTTPVTQVVSAAGTISTLAVTYGGGLFQEDALLSVSVTTVLPGAGIPTGTVTFSGGSMATTTVALDANGRATVTAPDVPRGNNTFTVTYSGGPNFVASTGTQTAFAPYVLIMPMIYK